MLPDETVIRRRSIALNEEGDRRSISCKTTARRRPRCVDFVFDLMMLAARFFAVRLSSSLQLRGIWKGANTRSYRMQEHPRL